MINYFIYLFLKFYFIFKLYIIVLVLPNIKMNLPQDSISLVTGHAFSGLDAPITFWLRGKFSTLWYQNKYAFADTIISIDTGHGALFEMSFFLILLISELGVPLSCTEAPMHLSSTKI